jgi:hypothetical protein
MFWAVAGKMAIVSAIARKREYMFFIRISLSLTFVLAVKLQRIEWLVQENA